MVISVTDDDKAVVSFHGTLIQVCSALGSSTHHFILHFVIPQVSARDGNPLRFSSYSSLFPSQGGG